MHPLSNAPFRAIKFPNASQSPSVSSPAHSSSGANGAATKASPSFPSVGAVSAAVPPLQTSPLRYLARPAALTTPKPTPRSWTSSCALPMLPSPAVTSWPTAQPAPMVTTKRNAWILNNRRTSLSTCLRPRNQETIIMGVYSSTSRHISPWLGV